MYRLNHSLQVSFAILMAMAIHFMPYAPARAGQIFQDFSSDPGWEGRSNVFPEGESQAIHQDFGYSATQYAGGEAGEIGGMVQRSFTPALYAAAIPENTLDDRLYASGKFSIPSCNPGSGVLVGWFNENSRGWRTPNSMAFRIDGEDNKYRVLFEYGTKQWGTGGGATFEGIYQTTKTPMFLAGGDSHEWALEYDPLGADGAGEILFTLDGSVYKAPLEPGHKEQGAAFNRFGIFNQQISGDSLSIYLDDLTIDEKYEEFTQEPQWLGIGNRTTFQNKIVRPYHHFGYRNTQYAGGASVGEVGGIMWRNESMEPERSGFYAVPAGKLTLDQELKASGKIAFCAGSADSGILIGWFNSNTFVGAPPMNSLCVYMEGPSRIGHYFRPAYGSSEDIVQVMDHGPIIRPDGKPHEWTLHYTPGPKGERGVILVTLDGERISMEVSPEAGKGNAVFDRFGFLSFNRGGHFVEVYVDDLSYTSGEEQPEGSKGEPLR